ncbi:thioesterase superfamily protein [Roseibium aquae]|uniref:Medium/long-chain acyl-CoA thioesterase YigI n=1 Tax=Roseibium aquae TaxID=1323746 RepID=A0A916TME2_9HYPH|nr:PaaI family thioesterase [Roseibium aquae]GGB58505.1 thioesterase superfamily protein [Roseibium aquae]
MSGFTPKDPDWENRLRRSFAAQAFMKHLGAHLTHIAPGAADISLSLVPEVTQQHGFFHGGVTASIADSAAGYAGLSLFAPGNGILTTEFKLNLLNPARQDTLVARGRVVKPGRTLTIAKADVFGVGGGGDEVHVATGLFTLMGVDGVTD